MHQLYAKVIPCGDGRSACNVGYTCSSDAYSQIGCCQGERASTCLDGLHCCPESLPVCDIKNGLCLPYQGANQTHEHTSVDNNTSVAWLAKQPAIPHYRPDLLQPYNNITTDWTIMYTHIEKPANRKNSADYSFQVIGDWGIDTEAKWNIANVMGNIGDSHESHFTINVGDSFYYNGVQSVDDPLWKSMFEDCYVIGNLWNPWYCVFGNHDHYGNAQAEIDYSEHSWRWNFPSPYYIVKYDLPIHSMHIIYLDTGAEGTAVAGDQLGWLREQLENVRESKWILVVGHHPVFSGGNHGSTQALVDHVRPLLEEYQVSAYIAGHNHGLEHLLWEGVHYLVSGGGGYVPDPELKYIEMTKFAFNGNGYMLYTIKTKSEIMHVKFYDQWGNEQYSVDIKPRWY